MISKRNKEKTGGLFYGWYVLGACFLTLMVAFGVRPTIGLFFKAIARDFDLTRAGLGLAVSINMLIYGLVQPVAGMLLDRHGPKLVMGFSATVTAAGMVIMGMATAGWQLYLIYGLLLGIGFGGLGFSTLTAIAARWFAKKRGLALGITISGSSVGQFAFTPLAAFLFLGYGWRWAQVLLGGLAFLVTLPLALWVMKRDPYEIGCGPDGEPLDRPRASLEAKGQISRLPNISPAQAFQTRQFWQLAGGFFVCGFSAFFVVTHLAAHITDSGYSDLVAASALALIGGVNFLGILSMGDLSDRIGRRVPLAATYLVRGLSFLLLLTTNRLEAIYLFAIIFGFSNMATVPVTSALVGDTFGPAHVGTILGMVSLSHQLGAALGTFYGGLLYDISGSYQYAFLTSFFLLVAASLLSYTVEERARVMPARLLTRPATLVSGPED